MMAWSSLDSSAPAQVAMVSVVLLPPELPAAGAVVLVGAAAAGAVVSVAAAAGAGAVVFVAAAAGAGALVAGASLPQAASNGSSKTRVASRANIRCIRSTIFPPSQITWDAIRAYGMPDRPRAGR